MSRADLPVRRACSADLCRQGRAPCPCPQACEVGDVPSLDASADADLPVRSDMQGELLALHVAVAAWAATVVLMLVTAVVSIVLF